MLKLPTEVRVYIALEPCDMRRQMDGLAALVRSSMERDLLAAARKRGNLASGSGFLSAA